MGVSVLLQYAMGVVPPVYAVRGVRPHGGSVYECGKAGGADEDELRDGR